MIYLLTFFVSCILLYISEHKRKGAKIYLIIGLGLPILIATLRNEKVGVDVATYMKPLFLNIMQSSNFTNLLANNKLNPALRELDIGYVVLCYIPVKIFKGIWALFAMNEIMTVLPIYYSIKYWNNSLKFENRKASLPLAMFWYYCVFFNNSLNQVRQIIACSLVLLAVTMVVTRSKRKIGPILLMGIAISIHPSAIIIVFIITIYYFIKKKNKIVSGILIIGFLAFLLRGQQIFVLMMDILYRRNLISSRYYSWTGRTADGGFNYSYLFVTLFMLVTALLLYTSKRLYSHDIHNKFSIYLSFGLLCSMPFAGSFANLGRLVLYLLIFCVLINPMLCYGLSGRVKNSKKIAVFANIIGALTYWIVAVAINDYTGTIPYLFAWQ